MTPLHEIPLSRRILELRETCAEPEDFAARLREDLRISSEESRALATALEDRFLSGEEQLDLLGSLELRGVLLRGSAPGALIARLAGTDGREAWRHHARHLTARLALDPRAPEEAPVSAETLSELAAMLPRGLGASGLAAMPFGSPTYGIYHYLRPEDSFLRALVTELRGNLAPAVEPVLRLRSARVLAEAGDREAADLLRETEAALAPRYAGGLTLDERIARACGLAADGHPAAIRFLQNIAMDPRAATERRARALSYLPADSLDNGSDAGEVFRSLAEDPEEPVATRYLMLRLLARAPHPPEAAWWRGLLSDASTTVSDRAFRAGEAAEASAEFSQWNLVLAALGESHAPWSADLLLEAMENGGLPAAQRREALMAYLRHEGRGTLPWDSVRGVLLAQSGWGATLAGVEECEGADLRLRFPERPETEPGAVFDIRGLNSIGKEVVLHLREGTTGVWMVDFRPLDPQRDALSSRPVLPEAEERFPLNRRVFVDAMGWELEPDETLPPAAVASAENAPYDPEPGAATPAGAAPTRLAANEPQRPLPEGPNHAQQNSNGGAAGGSGAGATPPMLGI